MSYTLLFISFFLLFSCEKEDEIDIPDDSDPPTVVDPVFDTVWTTRMDSTKEIIGTDNVQVYKDWYLKGGDYDLPPRILAFNTKTGQKEWTYEHEGTLDDEIDISKIKDNVFVGITGKGVLAVNLDTRELMWEFDLSAKNLSPRKGIIFRGDYFYAPVKWAFKTPNAVGHMLRFNYRTGEVDWIYGVGPKENSTSTTNTAMLSPPVFWEDPEHDRTLMIFNCGWSGSPDDYPQDLYAVDLETRELAWKVDSFTENFPTNLLHPPVVYEGDVITGGDWSIYSFDAQTGSFNWRTEFDYPWGIWNKTNHLIHEDRLYVNNGQDDVTCLDPSTGDIIWNNPKGGANCTDNMLYYDKKDLLVFTSWGYGSVMILDALTGETLHREHDYAGSSYNTDIAYDPQTDMFFTSTYKHAIAFKVNKPRY